MIDTHVRLEALTALLGAEVKPHTFFPSKFNPSSLFQVCPIATPRDFLAGTILGYNVLFANYLSTFSTSSRTSVPWHYAVKREIFVDMETFFDPPYDMDFTDYSPESTPCSRGGEPYNRPRGWYRMALNVRNKYPDGDTWLGPDGLRDHSVHGEWPVSYHGTGIDGAKGIIRSNYTAGGRAMYGRGVYSTPTLSEAQAYTKEKEFTSKNGKTYRVIMQNRINSLKREICKADGHNYWLVPVPPNSSSQEEREIVEAAIRPYGILIQEAT